MPRHGKIFVNVGFAGGILECEMWIIRSIHIHRWEMWPSVKYFAIGYCTIYCHVPNLDCIAQHTRYRYDVAIWWGLCLQIDGLILPSASRLLSIVNEIMSWFHPLVIARGSLCFSTINSSLLERCKQYIVLTRLHYQFLTIGFAKNIFQFRRNAIWKTSECRTQFAYEYDMMRMSVVETGFGQRTHNKFKSSNYNSETVCHILVDANARWLFQSPSHRRSQFSSSSFNTHWNCSSFSVFFFAERMHSIWCHPRNKLSQAYLWRDFLHLWSFVSSTTFIFCLSFYFAISQFHLTPRRHRTLSPGSSREQREKSDPKGGEFRDKLKR